MPFYCSHCWNFKFHHMLVSYASSQGQMLLTTNKSKAAHSWSGFPSHFCRKSLPALIFPNRCPNPLLKVSWGAWPVAQCSRVNSSFLKQVRPKITTWFLPWLHHFAQYCGSHLQHLRIQAKACHCVCVSKSFSLWTMNMCACLVLGRCREHSWAATGYCSDSDVWWETSLSWTEWFTQFKCCSVWFVIMYDIARYCIDTK